MEIVKEKAEELFDRFYLIKDERGLCRLNEFIAKQCALITVNEILNEYWLHDTERRDFWQDVKKEIKKL